MNITSALQTLGLSALLAVGFTIPSPAQTVSGSIGYSVPSKKPLEALVTFKNKTTNNVDTAHVDELGHYSIELPMGDFTQKIEALNHFTVEIDLRTFDDFDMSPINVELGIRYLLENKKIQLTGPNEYKNARELVDHLTGGHTFRQKDHFDLYLNYPQAPAEFIPYIDSLNVQIHRDIPNLSFNLVNYEVSLGANFHYIPTDSFPQGAGSNGFTTSFSNGGVVMLGSNMYIATELVSQGNRVMGTLLREFGRGVFGFDGVGRNKYMAMSNSALGYPEGGFTAFHPDEVLAANIVFAMPSGTDLSSWKDSVVKSIDFGNYIKSFAIVDNNKLSLERLSLDASFAKPDTVISTYHKSDNPLVAPEGITKVSEYFLSFNKYPSFTNGVLKVAINKLDGVINPNALKFMLEADGVWTDIGGMVQNDTLYSITPINSLSNIAIGTTNGDALPVELAYFKATRINDNIKFDWQTHSEKDNYGYTIQEKNKNEWTDKTFIQGHGTTTTKHDYTATITDQDGGKYRLKQTDLDGKPSFSQELTIAELITQFELLQNYPNPFNPETTIRFSASSPEPVHYKVSNVLGQVMVSGSQPAKAGYNEFRLSGTGLSSGLYFLSVQSGNGSKTIKIQVLK